MSAEGLTPIRHALISVSDKRGLAELGAAHAGDQRGDLGVVVAREARVKPAAEVDQDSSASGDVEGPGVGLIDVADEAQQRRFSRAVRPEQRDNLAVTYGKRYVIESPYRPIMHRQTFCFNHCSNFS